MSSLQDLWGTFSPEITSKFLRAYGSPSASLLGLQGGVLRRYAAGIANPKVLDIGCGDARLGRFFNEQELACDYTGVDFSNALLGAARQLMPRARFIKDDVDVLSALDEKFDIAFLSRVIEILPAPEDSLAAAAKLAKHVVIRFFSPPEFDRDRVELRWMEGADGQRVPYMHRKMTNDYYQLILTRSGCKRVDVFCDSNEDQIHVLVF